MLNVTNLTYRLGGRTIFGDATAQVSDGHKVGFVGCNGAGKTTLLRLILGKHELDGGSIRVRSRCSVGMVAQEAPGGDQTPLDAVLAADTHRAELLKEVQTSENPERICEIHNRLVDIDAHSAPSRAASILAGLGFDEQAQARPMKSFSGGWRMRVALAASLFSEPDLLLLDEPTNHLDLEATIWLESYLKSYPHTMLMVSHDRSLLSSVVDYILHLQKGKLEMFTGGYDSFERVRLARLSQTEAFKKKQDADRKRIQSFVDRFRAKATKARQAQSRLKVLERMTPVAKVTSEQHISFQFPSPGPSSSPLVRLDNAAVGYETDCPVLKKLRLSVLAADRIALLGPNGNGKTTLARLLSGRLKPALGQVIKSSKLRVGYFAQDQLEQLEPELTAIEQIRLFKPDDPLLSVRSWLGRFGFGQDKVEVPIEGLSGGEKTRLALALATLGKPNLLILDEPTNHLDMDARKALIEALIDYSGAIILISHDRHLIETTADQLWLVQNGTVEVFFGDLDEYRRLLMEESRARRSSQRQDDAPTGNEKRDRKEDRRTKAEARMRLAPLRKQVQEAEARLEELVAEKEKTETALSDPSTYSDASDKAAALSRRQRELEAEISTVEERWLEAVELLEKQLGSEK
ncbi:MAG: ABC-F family ATP-binding cassette domain-containing protein [Proteobacteria bacterium]|nr:ABC-F family ATP-binding cassette domain-containing protein [Pseudomonadota bacterium]